MIRATATARHVAIPGWTACELWNGRQTPHVERDAADLLAETLDQFGFTLRYDPEAGAYILLPEGHDPDEDDPDAADHFHGHDATLSDGRTLHLYSISTWVWCWEPAGTA